MGEQVRYGLVGTGMMGVEHLNNLAVTPGAVVTAIADPVATSLDWAKTALGDRAADVTQFADSAALARSGLVDAVIVASPAQPTTSGPVTASTDQNGQTTTTQYDPLGRVSKIIGPNDTATLPTLSYAYDLSTLPNKTTVSTRIRRSDDSSAAVR